MIKAIAPYAKAAVAVATGVTTAVIAAIQALYGAPPWTYVVLAGVAAVAGPLGVWRVPNAPAPGAKP